MNDIYTDQPLNFATIRLFLTRFESILLFLSLTLVVAVLLVVFGQPTSILGYFEQQSSLTPLGQITISFISGFGVLALSRVLLSLVGRKHDLSPAAMVIWIVAELIVCVSVIALVLWGLCGGGTVNLASLVGALVLGMAGVLLVPTVVTYLIRRLREAQDEVVRLRQLTGHQDGQAKQAAEATKPSNNAENFVAKFSNALSALQSDPSNKGLYKVVTANDGEDLFKLLRRTYGAGTQNLPRFYVLSALQSVNPGVMLEHLNAGDKVRVPRL